MSGGVDSSAVALILKKEGYDVIGISMKLNDAKDSGKGRCCSLDDFRDARKVADILDIPYYVINMEEEFDERVVKSFVADYLEGRTPNPCILCNHEMKFDLLLAKALDLEADYLATGHYSKIDYDDKRKRYILKKGADKLKDQSYFLFSMTQEQLSRVLFPLASYHKKDIRKMLSEAGIKIADKAESQDICFIDDGGYSSYIERSVGIDNIKGGRIVSSNGTAIGKHDGIHRFTIGQRKGLGLSSHKRLYVLGFDHENRDVIVGEERGLLAGGLVANGINWLSIDAPDKKFKAYVKTRYSSEEHHSTLYPSDDGKVLIKFDLPQRAVTPGQAVVFYSADELLGGGWIERALN